jgi:putative PIN family toxin of toxin-antitoxin system
MQAVLDANVFISGLLSKKGPPGQILDAWLEGKFSLFISSQIVAEVQRVLEYPRIRERLESGEADSLIKRLMVASKWIEGKLVLEVLNQDPSDNIYLACAVEAQAEFLVTGNLKHYSEAGNPFQGVEILTPRQFLEILNRLD